MRWDYQRDLYRLYRERWNEEHRQQQAAYRRKYRFDHPEETLRQWQQDTARYRERMNPDVLRERQRIYNARYLARKRTEEAIERAEHDS